MASNKKLLRQEARLESSFMSEIGTLPFTEACRKDGTLIAYPSYGTKRDRSGNKVKDFVVSCRVQDIHNHATFRKFCKEKGYTGLIRLSQAESIRDEYVLWLRKYSDERYVNLDMGGQEWLRKVALKAVKSHIAESKWLGWYNDENKDDPAEDYWCDSRLRDLYGIGYLARTQVQPLLISTLKKVIEGIMKDPEDLELRKRLDDTFIKVVADGITSLLVYNPTQSAVSGIEEEWRDEDRKETVRRKVSDINGTGEIAI